MTQIRPRASILAGTMTQSLYLSASKGSIAFLLDQSLFIMALKGRAPFFGWREYPHNLNLPATEIDASKCCERISESAKRLFVPEGESCVDVLAVRNDPEGVSTAWLFPPLSDVQPGDGKCSSRFFFIRQPYSWTQLLISEVLFRKLMTIFRVHPAFLEVVLTFGEKIAPVEESQCSFFASISSNGASDSTSNRPPPSGSTCSFEIAYNIKYVARHGRKYPKDPYSVRESGVYQKHTAASQQCTWILLQPSNELEERLQRHMFDPLASNPNGHLLIHALILLVASEDWREYVNYLEDEFSKLLDRGFFSSVRGSNTSGSINADFSDIRALHILADKLRKLLHILSLNRGLGARIKDTFQSLLSPVSTSGEVSSLLYAKLDLYDFQISTQHSRIDTLISRSEGVRSLIQHILDMRSSENNGNINRAMRDLTEQGVEENRLMRRLSNQATRDTRSMMVIAIITAIFLPATFAATFFGSNFFGFVNRESGSSLEAASNLWIYFVVAVALSGLAVSFVLIYYRVNCTWIPRDGTKDEDAEKDSEATVVGQV
ncbi:ankyrin repeat protein [Diplodia corticola]|uniref:Ankyrin repeat protein n=1 Tax=Diplodia corticola TaxID=236234 RepID=A0A1J9RW68_9PEZI|nr:ankyrin repeat protein [Diplodia corticola]OJD36867.1 ankyrin repeat protein [Diplodia corticola]